jgi:methionine-R-sulfoxide reductase
MTKKETREILRKLKKGKSLALALVLSAAVLGVFYQHNIVSGVAWMAGTQNLDVVEQRFSDDSDNYTVQRVNSTERFWIQKDYSDEIENLSKREYYVTQKNGTEPPFQNELYDEKRPGIYVDVVSGAPLFSSKHKFDSGTGWPSFYKPLESENIIERRDPGPLGVRTEIASKHAKTHLGHLFRNPNTPTGLRYCLNSAAMEFIPAGQLEEKGYGMYSRMFNSTEKEERI